MTTHDAAVVTPQARRRDWRDIYSLRLAITDLLVLVWVVFGVQIGWFGSESRALTIRDDLFNLDVSYTVVTVVVILGWMALLQIFGTRGHRVLGVGAEEYRRIASATGFLFGFVAIVAYLFRIDVARGYILIAFPLGLTVLMFSRWMWRQWLAAQRLHGRFSSTVLLVGSVASASHIARELVRHRDAGYRVVGACVANGSGAGELPGTTIPVLGNFEEVLEALETSGADTVVLTSSDDLSPQRIREMSWSLEAGRHHLVVVPSLTDIGGPRIHTRPVAGLPLIHVETPSYEGRKQFAKRALDIAGSGLLLLVLALPLLVLAVVVKRTSDGPVLFRQERVGLNGDPFTMLKFRTMRDGADAELPSLLDEQGKSDRPLFKIQNDPRITNIGRVLRTYSIDEFPQLINVFRGDMSLVGPRPQREGEVALYDAAAHRRLLLKPGMSGLWQVSGRSSLSWADSIRLDLYYVENWSMTGDIVILWRTVKAVVAPGKEAH